MNSKVLWLDNDPGYIKPFALALEDAGLTVALVSNISSAEKKISSETFDLLILDVMIPTINSSEEEVYTPEETDNSLRVGLLFYKKFKEYLKNKGVEVMVLTVRIDKAIKGEFLQEGLPESRFVTKMEVRESPVFVSRVKTILAEKNQRLGGQSE